MDSQQGIKVATDVWELFFRPVSLQLSKVSIIHAHIQLVNNASITHTNMFFRYIGKTWQNMFLVHVPDSPSGSIESTGQCRPEVEKSPIQSSNSASEGKSVKNPRKRQQPEDEFINMTSINDIQKLTKQI